MEPADMSPLGHRRTVTTRVAMIERRHRQRPATRMGFLEHLPALTLLDRLTMPTIAVGMNDGILLYANPASAVLFGYADSATLTAQSLPILMADHAVATPRECAAALLAVDGAAIAWNHADGFRIRTMVSPSLLARHDDPVLLVSLTDETELTWTNGHSRARTLPTRRA